MIDLKSRLEGKYSFPFFGMKINSLTFGSTMSDKEISVFVHEYIHFLQSFSTYDGLTRINSDYTTLISMINWVKTHKELKINTPLTEDILGEVTRSNRILARLTWGESDDIMHFQIKDVFIDYDNPNIVDEYRSIEDVIITYIDEDLHTEGICSFAAREIYESMAYLIEQNITTDYDISPDFPYNSATKVAEFLYPPIVKDYRNILVICDKSLMSSNPGCEYIEIIKWLKSIEYTPTTPDELYYMLDANWCTYNLDDRIYWLDNFKNYAEHVRYNLHSLLQDPYFDDYHKWVDTIFDYAIELRTNEPMFWLDIVDRGDVKNNTFLYAIRHFAGSPLIETAKHELFFQDPEDSVDSTCIIYMKVFEQIYNLFLYDERRCKLMPWCNDPRNTVTVDCTCHSCPWKHPENNGELCTFKGIWQHLGLNNVRFNE